MRIFATALPLLLLAGCNTGRDGDENVSTNQLQRLSTGVQEPETDPLASARPQPLVPGDMTQEGFGGPGCRFNVGGSILLAAGGTDAIARIGGETLHFTQSAPVGPSGGFFRRGPISISVGRTDAAETPVSDIAGSPGRIAVTNRRTGVQFEQDGIWRCGA